MVTVTSRLERLVQLLSVQCRKESRVRTEGGGGRYGALDFFRSGRKVIGDTEQRQHYY